MAERSTAGVVGMFFVVPVLAGGAIVSWVVARVVTTAADLTAGEWLWEVGWFGLLGLALATGLPAAGWQELRRRRGRPAVTGPPRRARRAGPR
jgi:hypothetical protein